MIKQRPLRDRGATVWSAGVPALRVSASDSTSLRCLCMPPTSLAIFGNKRSRLINALALVTVTCSKSGNFSRGVGGLKHASHALTTHVASSLTSASSAAPIFAVNSQVSTTTMH